MVTDAEPAQTRIGMLNEMTPVFKVTPIRRVTRIGRFLRKFSLDEFPQLIRRPARRDEPGGPRPLPLDEVKRFDDLAHRRRLSVKPGITCLWQVSGGVNVKDFRDWVRLDLEYIDNWSLWLDFKILFRTIPVVLFGREPNKAELARPGPGECREETPGVLLLLIWPLRKESGLGRIRPTSVVAGAAGFLGSHLVGVASENGAPQSHWHRQPGHRQRR